MDTIKDTPDAEVIEAADIRPEPSAPKANALVRLGTGVLFRSVAEVWAVAEGLRKGGAGPKGSTTGSIAAAIIKGQTLGLDPITAMGNITVVNGRASLMGDLALSLVRKAGLINPKAGGFLREEWSGVEGSDEYRCTITAKRCDTGEEMSRSFSFGDAKRAGLLRTAIWTGFLSRMLRYRALGFLLRDLFGDVLMGLHLTEELQGAEAFGPAPEPAALPESASEVAQDPFFSAPEPKALPEPKAPEIEADLVLDPSLVTVVEEAPVPQPVEPPAKRNDAVQGTEFDEAAERLLRAAEAAAEQTARGLGPSGVPNAPDDPFRGFRDDEVIAAKPDVKVAPARPATSRRRRW